MLVESPSPSFRFALLGLDVLLVLDVCAKELVPPHKGGGIVAYEVLVVEVMETSTCDHKDESVTVYG